jgi:hypothetical protein
MPKIVPILPSQDEAKSKENIVKLLEAAAALGVALDPQGFAHFWVTDSARVVVAYDGDKPTGWGIMTHGRRFFDGNITASVLQAEGPDRKAVLDFLLDMARMLGASTLFYQGDELGGEPSDMKIVTVT